MIDTEELLIGFLMQMEMVAQQKFTHAEVRAVARCSYVMMTEFYFPDELAANVKYYLCCLSKAGIPHYDRTFCARRITEAIYQWQSENKFKGLLESNF